MYAILDIETTGGKYNEEGITEIAIYKYNGHEVVDQFISLINPERPIQPFVVNLTGINNEMLRNAPKFYEVAKRIVEITQDCIIVAHNAQFDYRILSTEFDRLGYEYNRESLCTVELSKKLLPDLKSYSLGKMVKELGIPMTDRHRASGDAKATVILFKLLLQRDIGKEIISTTVKIKPKRQVDKKLIRLIETVPAETGVYYLHREDGKIIYIGKSRNIKKRILQHFTSDNRKSKKIQEEVYAVSFDKTGSDLIAQLKESQEIKLLKPKYNRGLTKTLYPHQLVSYTNQEGYICLKTEKTNRDTNPITTFTNIHQTKSFMLHITAEFELCQKFTSIYTSAGACFAHGIGECSGACIGTETPEIYNERVHKFLDKHSYENKNMILIDNGRDVDERSAILIEDGKFKGIAFYNLNYQINNVEVLKSILTPMEDNRDAKHIIQGYLRRGKVRRIINLP